MEPTRRVLASARSTRDRRRTRVEGGVARTLAAARSLVQGPAVLGLPSPHSLPASMSREPLPPNPFFQAPMTSKASFSPWRPHPWHGLSAGAEPPSRLTAFIELTPYDLVKYEIDKDSGYLRLDRPQRTSAQPPSLYGFVPRTYSGKRVAKLMSGAEVGDGDPLAICVLCEP